MLPNDHQNRFIVCVNKTTGVKSYNRTQPDFLGLTAAGLLSPEPPAAGATLASFISLYLRTSLTSSRKHSSTFTWSLAEVSKNGHLYCAASCSPSVFCTTLCSSKSHLLPT